MQVTFGCVHPPQNLVSEEKGTYLMETDSRRLMADSH